jgi:predicted TIM-barrel fold metal-dependent hydrolase
MRNHVSGSRAIAASLGKGNRAPHTPGDSRRQFLKSLAVAGAIAALPATRLLAQVASFAAKTARGGIDVHHHMLPPSFLNPMKNQLAAAGRTNLVDWSPSVSIDRMEKKGIATAIMSPALRLVGDSFSDDTEKARTMAREHNEYGAQLVKDYPGRFGLFAALPLPDQEGSLKEIEYSFDVLRADGVGLWTSYLDKWPGDPAFAATFEELNRRKAVVFFHPATATCCRSLIPGIAPGVIEYDIDTGRAITSLLVNGTFAKFPNIRFIFSHSGGILPVLAARIADDFPAGHAASAPKGIPYELKKLYYEVAHATSAPTLAALTKFVPISQIMLGTDFPMVDDMDVTLHSLKSYGFSATDLRSINRGNAVQLFPRFEA